MASGRSIDGLLKWLRRDEWRSAFENVLDEHLGRACAKADIEVDDLASLIGGDRFMTLWGCAFEDFLSRDLDDGRNMVDEYLKRRGWKESATNKAYIAGLRSSVMSLYEVSEIVPGQSFLARDLVRGGEPVKITEHTATRSLRQWDRIAARVVAGRRKNVIGGGLLPFDHETSETVLGMINRTTAAAEDKTRELVREFGRDVNDEALTDALSDEAVLRAAAPSFTTVWLDDVLQKVLEPTSPAIYNSEGEELLFSTVHYPLKPNVAPSDVRAAIAAIPAFRQESESFWNWVGARARTAKGAPGRTGRSLVTQIDDEALVLGNLELTDKTLSLSANSRSRAKQGRALLEPALKGLVREPLVETQSVEQMMAEHPAEGEREPTSDLSPEDERAMVHQLLDRHYAETLEDPIPMLGDISPLEAATTPEGREKLVDWLKLLENHSARQPAGEPVADYDFTWLWERLGVANLRR